MRKITRYAQRNLDNVAVGVTMGLPSPRRGIGIEITLQRSNLRWGFRLRQGSNLFYAVEQRPGLFHYGLRSDYGPRGGRYVKVVPHPLKLPEITKEWPKKFWPNGLKLLNKIATIRSK